MDRHPPDGACHRRGRSRVASPHTNQSPHASPSPQSVLLTVPSIPQIGGTLLAKNLGELKQRRLTLSVRANRSPQMIRKLLVIDDDAKLLASYKDLLAPYGFEVLTAADGRLAMPIVESHPDIMLVILDLKMPGMDGMEWLRWYRDGKRDCPVIVISAYKFESDEALLQPAATLEKPFHVAELLDLVGLFCGLGTPTASMESSGS